MAPEGDNPYKYNGDDSAFRAEAANRATEAVNAASESATKLNKKVVQPKSTQEIVDKTTESTAQGNQEDRPLLDRIKGFPILNWFVKSR